MSDLLELLSYPFAYRALIAGGLVAVCASVLGVILVLKHYSLIGHGLSEVGFASLSIASALGLPVMLVSAPAVIIASFAIMFVSQRFKTAGDIAIAVASSAALALGVLVSSLTGQTSAVNSYLFGSVLAVSESDMILAVMLSATVLGVFAVFYNRLFLITYNEDYARSLGINSAYCVSCCDGNADNGNAVDFGSDNSACCSGGKGCVRFQKACDSVGDNFAGGIFCGINAVVCDKHSCWSGRYTC